MKCEEFRDKTDAYLEQELSKTELIHFENHLKSCRDCQMEMESIKKCIDLMKNVFNDKKPPSKIKKMVFEKTCCDEKDRKVCCPSENDI